MNQAAAEFGSKIGGSEAALFYFAGHGIQVKGQNYLMPVNAKVESEAAVPFQGFNVNQILEEMDNGKSGANIVMLDACRNNPISGKFRSSPSRGLASPGVAPQGTVIVYATDPGNVAADGVGRNGLFSAGILAAFKGGDLSLDGVLTAASEYVEQKSLEIDSTRKQTPYVNEPKTLQKNFHFRVSVEAGDTEIEKTFWISMHLSTDIADYEAYLKKFPRGNYLALAENQIKRLKASSSPGSGISGMFEAAARQGDGIDTTPAKSFRDCPDCPEMVMIPAGSIRLGAVSGDSDGRDVRLNQPVAMGRYEVTRKQFAEFVRDTGHSGGYECAVFDNGSWFMRKDRNWQNPGFQQDDNHPVVCVNWDDARAYAAWLTQRTGKPYRLPYEDEWEYAARAGSMAARFWGNDADRVCQFANVADTTARQQVPGMSGWTIHRCTDGHAYTAPVGSFQANDFGLFDVLGNAWEWIDACWDDPIGFTNRSGGNIASSKCSRPVRRGGSWIDEPNLSHLGFRHWDAATVRSQVNGFRVVRSR